MKGQDLDKKIRKLISSGDWQALLKLFGAMSPEELSLYFNDFMDELPSFGSVLRQGEGVAEAPAGPDASYSKEDEKRIKGHIRRMLGDFRIIRQDGLQSAYVCSNLPSPALVSIGLGASPSSSNRKEGEGYERTEIILFLPGGMDAAKMKWPMAVFSSLYRISHDGKGFLAPFFMYDNGGAYAPDASFSGCILIPPMDGEAAFLTLSGGERVSFLIAVPLYDDEMDYKDSFGLGRLLDRLLPDSVIADPFRESRADFQDDRALFSGCIADMGIRMEQFRRAGLKVTDDYSFATEITYFLIWAVRRYMVSPAFLRENGDLVHKIVMGSLPDIRRDLWKAYDGILFASFFSREGRLFASYCFSPDSYGLAHHYPSMFLYLAGAYASRNLDPSLLKTDPRAVFPYCEETFREVSVALDMIYRIWRREEDIGARIGSEVHVPPAVGFYGPSGCLVSPTVFDDPEKGCVFIRDESLDPAWDSGWRVYSSEDEKGMGAEEMMLMDLKGFENRIPDLREVLPRSGTGASYVLGGK